MNTFNEQEQAAVSAISNIMSQGSMEKRDRASDDSPNVSGVVRPNKMMKVVRELKPAPYFCYRDRSMEPDLDPLCPLTPPGRVPNFPAKMHAILSRTDFAEIVSWLPHGRSWRVLKPREFEIKVIPLFFEHSKYSSFVRQANGWGFRRITQGKDRNSYYHENFLRGLPHLCKTMKRPGINEKKQANPEHEPDFYMISDEHPLPEKADDDSILLHCTMQGGPKARMPIYWGSTMAASLGFHLAAPSMDTCVPVVGPKDQMMMQSFQQAVVASENQVVHQKEPAPVVAAPAELTPAGDKPIVSFPSFMVMPATPNTAPTSNTTVSVPSNQFAALAAAHQMAFQIPAFPIIDPQAASQFAAGFAAATAFSQQHFSSMFNSMVSQQQQQALHQAQHVAQATRK